MITLKVGSTTLELDPDLYWSDEFSWGAVEQSFSRSLTGASLIDVGIKIGGRPITLEPADSSSGWMSRATLTQLQAWEAQPDLVMTLLLRGGSREVVFNRMDGTPIEAAPVVFVANAMAGEVGDYYLATIRFIEV